jgi:hypothetical protein
MIDHEEFNPYQAPATEPASVQQPRMPASTRWVIAILWLYITVVVWLHGRLLIESGIPGWWREWEPNPLWLLRSAVPAIALLIVVRSQPRILAYGVGILTWASLIWFTVVGNLGEIPTATSERAELLAFWLVVPILWGLQAYGLIRFAFGLPSRVYHGLVKARGENPSGDA